MIKSMRMGWAGHVARMGRKGMHIGFCWESQKERDHWEDLDVGGRVTLKWILK
jgi:superfamily II DNA/RNA helicase